MIKKKILIVEDEPIIAMNLKEVLIELGYEISGIAPSRSKTLALLDKGIRPDLVLMDIYLKGTVTGIELAKELKTIIPDTPIIFLTANSELSTIKKAASAYAYGYLIKPVKERELHANIELALQKSSLDAKTKEQLNSVENIAKTLEHTLQESKEEKLTFITLKYGYVFYIEKKALHLKGKLVSLTVKERDLMALLCQQKGNFVSREQIEHSIWANEPAGEAAFRSLMFRVRNKLHKDLIINSNNIGYKIARL
ncbi:MAG: DNA-binding response OmpR family regulator [Sulfurimonas sp.]|jgi:DNA-binding response OmpR family regulator|uniref:response regulator n=1 Tax=Sulfurimonas sp. TaxID=2022749 RepID=UPI0039E37AB4